MNFCSFLAKNIKLLTKTFTGTGGKPKFIAFTGLPVNYWQPYSPPQGESRNLGTVFYSGTRYRVEARPVHPEEDGAQQREEVRAVGGRLEVRGERDVAPPSGHGGGGQGEGELIWLNIHHRSFIR